MAQAIPLLRKCTVEGKAYALLDDSKTPVSDIKSATTITFPDTQTTPFPLFSPSGYKTYPLQSIVFFLENKDVSFAEYFQLCLQNEIVQVSLTDRKDLLGYLVGKNETLPNYVAVESVSLASPSKTTVASPKATAEKIIATPGSPSKVANDLKEAENLVGRQELASSLLGKRVAEDVLMKDVGDLGVEDVFKKSRLLDSVVVGGNVSDSLLFYCCYYCSGIRLLLTNDVT
jgi:hypothetical protein